LENGKLTVLGSAEGSAEASPQSCLSCEAVRHTRKEKEAQPLRIYSTEAQPQPNGDFWMPSMGDPLWSPIIYNHNTRPLYMINTYERLCRAATQSRPNSQKTQTTRPFIFSKQNNRISSPYTNLLFFSKLYCFSCLLSTLNTLSKRQYYTFVFLSGSRLIKGALTH